MWLLKAKSYCVFALYPVVFSAGAVLISNLFKKKQTFVYLTAASILLPMLYFIPQLTPILPIKKYVEFYGIEEHNGRVELT